MSIDNYLTIDVEDYFQVSAFEPLVPKENWREYPSRVVDNTRRILDILEQKSIKATFFILGWTAKKHPELVREIALQGHEIGCHSYYHRLVYTLTPEQFHEDTKTAKDILEQITGTQVKGYRAPSYSITRKSLWAIQILNDLGFAYDSSVFPIHHDRYGIPDAPRYPFHWDTSADHPKVGSPYLPVNGSDSWNSLIEFPISTSLLLGKNLPVSGGGYFRLFPYWFTRMALKKINEQEQKSFAFYLHPWEFDPGQPRFNQASLLSKFRHYNNLHKTEKRFLRLLDDFSFKPMQAAHNITLP